MVRERGEGGREGSKEGGREGGREEGREGGRKGERLVGEKMSVFLFSSAGYGLRVEKPKGPRPEPPHWSVVPNSIAMI